MKSVLSILALAGLLLLTGCAESKPPITTGTASSGMIWERPMSSASNEGHGIPENAYVYVYERVIVVYHKDGSKEIAPLDHVSDLKLK